MGVLTGKPRDEMVEFFVNDLEGWLKRDRSGFLEHVREMERKYLNAMPYKELHQLYESNK